MDKLKIKWGKDVVIMALTIGLLLGAVLVFSVIQKKADLRNTKKSEKENDIIGSGCYGQ